MNPRPPNTPDIWTQVHASKKHGYSLFEKLQTILCSQSLPLDQNITPFSIILDIRYSLGWLCICIILLQSKAVEVLNNDIGQHIDIKYLILYIFIYDKYKTNTQFNTDIKLSPGGVSISSRLSKKKNNKKKPPNISGILKHLLVYCTCSTITETYSRTNPPPNK